MPLWSNTARISLSVGTWSGKITKYISTFKLENYCTSLFGLEVAHYGLVGGDGWLLDSEPTTMVAAVLGWSSTFYK